jgi:hypothetical protein
LEEIRKVQPTRKSKLSKRKLNTRKKIQEIVRKTRNFVSRRKGVREKKRKATVQMPSEVCATVIIRMRIFLGSYELL